jgi:hypothetical protein
MHGTSNSAALTQVYQMSYFPSKLYINAFDGSFSIKPSGNLTDGMPDTFYQLLKVMGCKAYYHYGLTKVLIVQDGIGYKAVG